ncbi:MAG TPA: response regulator, partial [Kaistiaceae bacterium]|nr:response regulator [Kaistiaceae bacterium]
MAKAASAEIEFGPASASSGRSPAHRKILVAEDDRASADVLRALLTERGHTVDVVGDGEAAIHALNSGVYDVVMVDFHLARLDGLEVAAAYRVKHSGKHAPRFIAISSDMRGLLEHAASCETFDEVVAKPFDLEDVCRIVEDEYQPQLRRAEPVPPRAGAPRPMAPEPTPARAGAAAGAADGFDFERLNWPEDFRGDQLSARAMRAAIGDGKFRAIVVNQPATLDDLRAIWRVKYLHTLPIVDRHGGLGVRADFDGSQFGFRDREEIDKLVAAFENRRSLL